MQNANAQFCSQLLREQRMWIRAAGIKVGRLSTYRGRQKPNFWYEVWEHGRGHGAPVWSGTASCASEAKTNYLLKRIREKE